MDPFSALNIATSANQIVDFSLKILKDAYAIYKRGSDDYSGKLLTATIGLRDLCKGLRADLKSNSLIADLADDERVSSVG
jgi:hypothetical protein